jgi:uncharacterized protein (DUF4415 family)
MAIKIRGNPGSPKMEKLVAKGTVIGEKKSRKILGIPPKAKVTHAKPIITIRVAPEVLEFFKADGPGWQTRMNDFLLRHVQAQKGRVE